MEVDRKVDVLLTVIGAKAYEMNAVSRSRLNS